MGGASPFGLGLLGPGQVRDLERPWTVIVLAAYSEHRWRVRTATTSFDMGEQSHWDSQQVHSI